MQSAEVNRTAIGLVRKPHGVKGGLKVTLYSIDLVMLQELEQLFVNTGNTWEKLSLKDFQGYDDYAIIHFAEIKDRNSAESYRELELYAQRDMLPELDDDEFYIEDLIGCEVLSENGISQGKVTEILSPGAHDVLVVNKDDSETLIPLVDEWVVDIDIKSHCIQVNTPEEIR